MQNILMVANAAYSTAAVLGMLALASRVGVAVPRWTWWLVGVGAACWATVTVAACYSGELGMTWYAALVAAWGLIQTAVAIGLLGAVYRRRGAP